MPCLLQVLCLPSKPTSYQSNSKARPEWPCNRPLNTWCIWKEFHRGQESLTRAFDILRGEATLLKARIWLNTDRCKKKTLMA